MTIMTYTERNCSYENHVIKIAYESIQQRGSAQGKSKSFARTDEYDVSMLGDGFSWSKFNFLLLWSHNWRFWILLAFYIWFLHDLRPTLVYSICLFVLKNQIYRRSFWECLISATDSSGGRVNLSCSKSMPVFQKCIYYQTDILKPFIIL